jgi:hypothetical protein
LISSLQALTPSCTQSVTLQSADELTFMLAGRDGGKDDKMSITQYFKKMYNVNLRYPRLPCVQVSLAHRFSEGPQLIRVFRFVVWQKEVSVRVA